MGGDPARDEGFHVRDLRVPGGRRCVRRRHPRVDGGGPDRQPGDHAEAGPARRAVRRHPGVPGRRQPLHRAVLQRHRRADQHRRGAECLPGHRVPGRRLIRRNAGGHRAAGAGRGAGDRGPPRRAAPAVAAAPPAAARPARPQVLRPGGRPHAADHAVPDHARRGGPDLEEPDVQRPLRGRELGDCPGRHGLDRVRVALPAGVHRRGARVAMDAVHDADHARRPPEPARRGGGGGQGRRRQRVRDLPPAHPSASPALHGARHAPRHDLPDPGVRPRGRDDRRRSGFDQHSLLRLPTLDRRRMGVREGLRLQHRRGRRLDRRRHGRPARAVPFAAGGGDRLMAGPARAQRGVGERRSVNTVMGVVAWLATLLFFFPVFWMVLSSFKEEQDANTSPKLLFSPTLDRYRDITDTTSGLLSFREAFFNSFWVVTVSTVVVLSLAIPAAYALAIRPVPKWRDVLFFFISTKFLPVVAAILPLWILAREFDLLNTRLVLMILYTGMNLPLAVWMLWSFFREIPRELVEAAEIDGAGLRGP